MSIVLVGGHDRMHQVYRELGRERGHRIKVFTQMPAKFDKAIGQPDAMIVMTSTVSHKMLQVASRQARKKNIPVMHCHCSGGCSLMQAVEEL